MLPWLFFGGLVVIERSLKDRRMLEPVES
jgi:hypothetical protein